MLIQCKPDKSISEVVQIIKWWSAYQIRKTHPELEEFLWWDSFWADGYFAESVWVHQEDMIKKYIDDQWQ
jgi:putative transposase